MEFRHDYWFLSNMYPCLINYEGLTFKSVEAAFQAAKCQNKADRIQFTELTATDAKHLGRRIALRPDWEQVKISIMTDLIRQKFTDPALRAQLMQIKGKIVEDNNWGDTFWGCCNGVGENNLGRIIMSIRNGEQGASQKQSSFYLLIAGSRTFSDYETLVEVTDKLLKNRIKAGETICIIHGAAKGADTLANQYAQERGFQVVAFPADWKNKGRAAGYIRNREMHEYLAEQDPSGKHRGCLCFWDGLSHGTKHNFELCKKYGTPLHVHKYSFT